MAARPRHQRKELEAVLQLAERQDWIVTKSGKYFKMYCPCVDKHLKTVHLTPSDPNYVRNLLNKLHRDTCLRED